MNPGLPALPVPVFSPLLPRPRSLPGHCPGLIPCFPGLCWGPGGDQSRSCPTRAPAPLSLSLRPPLSVPPGEGQQDVLRAILSPPEQTPGPGPVFPCLGSGSGSGLLPGELMDCPASWGELAPGSGVRAGDWTDSQLCPASAERQVPPGARWGVRGGSAEGRAGSRRPVACSVLGPRAQRWAAGEEEWREGRGQGAADPGGGLG